MSFLLGSICAFSNYHSQVDFIKIDHLISNYINVYIIINKTITLYLIKLKLTSYKLNKLTHACNDCLINRGIQTIILLIHEM